MRSLLAALSLCVLMVGSVHAEPGDKYEGLIQPVQATAMRGGHTRSPTVRRAARHDGVVFLGSGVVRSGKTGAAARVSAQYSGAFQSYVDALEAAGASVHFMGGIRAGGCSLPRHKHPCGMALDVCQLRRGVVDQRCHLPGPSTVAHLAAQAGLFEGGQWCNSDYGHVEAGGGAPACGQRQFASRRHRHARYASAR